MRARDIVGKKVARVEQHNYRDDEYPSGTWIVLRIHFHDGSHVWFQSVPTIDCPEVVMHYADKNGVKRS